jgi:hypothetical protein
MCEQVPLQTLHFLQLVELQNASLPVNSSNKQMATCIWINSLLPCDKGNESIVIWINKCIYEQSNNHSTFPFLRLTPEIFSCSPTIFPRMMQVLRYI